MTFGNIRDRSLEEIFTAMKSHFPSDSACFINKNFPLIRAAGRGRGFLDPAASLQVMAQAEFGERSGFFQLYLRDPK
jgi:hypothetical protein